MYIKISEKHSRIPEYLTLGKIYKVEGRYYTDDHGDQLFYMGGKHCSHIDGYWSVVADNRQTLRDFIKLNQIKTTLVSKQLGKSKGWLTQVMNRTDRGDLSDQELQSIMKQLHVDWTNTQYVNVKATKTHSAYRTRPCVYEHAKHKELLQRAFWDGRIVK